MLLQKPTCLLLCLNFFHYFCIALIKFFQKYFLFSFLGYVLDGFPSLCEDWLSMADQLDLVKNLPLTPDFIINMKVKNIDELKGRSK